MSILKIYLDGFCTNLLSNTVPLTYTIIDLQKSKNLLPHIEITFYAVSYTHLDVYKRQSVYCDCFLRGVSILKLTVAA